MKRRFGADVANVAGAVPFSGGAAVVAGSVAAVYADRPSALGSAIDVADRHGAAELSFFCDRSTAETARRAAEFRLPVSVIDPEGDFTALAPAPVPTFAPMPAELALAGARMQSAGLELEWEGGVLAGEWLGLEVARASGAAVEVGVGRHDRDANRELYPDGAPDQFLDQAVAAVRACRLAGAPAHPANQLAPERWLRAVVRRHPSLVGVRELWSGPAPVPRDDLRQRAVAPAWADDSGLPVVVVFSVGVDPDVVPQAADARVQAPGWPGFPAVARVCPLVIVVPAGDDHPLTRRLAGLLRHPARVVTVPNDWRALGGVVDARP